MRAKQLTGHETRTHVLVLETGDEAASGLLEYVRSERIGAATISAIGAFSEVVLGYFDVERKEYARIPVREQVEVLTLMGDVALEGAEPRVHVHVVVGRRDGSAYGGHLLEARVRPTLEVVLTEVPGHLQRVMDPQSGLPLIRP